MKWHIFEIHLIIIAKFKWLNRFSQERQFSGMMHNTVSLTGFRIFKSVTVLLNNFIRLTRCFSAPWWSKDHSTLWRINQFKTFIFNKIGVTCHTSWKKGLQPALKQTLHTYKWAFLWVYDNITWVALSPCLGCAWNDVCYGGISSMSCFTLPPELYEIMPQPRCRYHHDWQFMLH